MNKVWLNKLIDNTLCLYSIIYENIFIEHFVRFKNLCPLNERLKNTFLHPHIFLIHK